MQGDPNPQPVQAREHHQHSGHPSSALHSGDEGHVSLFIHHYCHHSSPHLIDLIDLFGGQYLSFDKRATLSESSKVIPMSSHLMKRGGKSLRRGLKGFERRSRDGRGQSRGCIDFLFISSLLNQGAALGLSVAMAKSSPLDVPR